MDEIWLKKQFKSMGASVKIITLQSLPRRFERRRIIDRLKVEAGPRGQVFTFACRPAVRDHQAAQTTDVCPPERHLVLLVRLTT